MKTELCKDGTCGHLLMFWCEGCRTHHAPRVGGTSSGPVWAWNGDRERPTVQPSIRVQGTVPLTEDEYARVMAGELIEPKPLLCHTFLTDGRLQYLGDCTHALAGQTVDLQEMD